MVGVALVNTLYRLAVVIVLSPAIGMLERIVCVIFPESEEAAAEQADMDRLESRFLTHPALALTQSKTVIDSMAAKALESVSSAVDVRRDFSRDKLKKVFDLEGVLDRYEDKLGSYLFKITAAELDDEQSAEVSKYMRALSDLERISDHARNIGEAVEEKFEKKFNFSEMASRELMVLEDAIEEVARLTLQAFVYDDTNMALRIDPLEEVVDDLCDELKAHHTDRISRQECTFEHSFVFNDLLTDYERISDHCSNIAVDIIEAGPNGTQAHEYHMSTDYRQDQTFQNYYNEYKDKYVKAI
jgi:phosphate:Na+ symporter